MKPRHSSRRIHSFPALILAGALAAASSHAATLTWAGATNTLNAVGNWVPSQLPVTGDSFSFGVAGAGGLLLNNDLTADFNIGAITYNSGAGAFVIGDGTATANLGNTFVLNGNVTNNSTSLQIINTPFTMTAGRSFTTAAGGGDIVLGGNISGVGGGITKGITTGGTLTLVGTNTYTGATTINSGLLKVTGSTVAASAVAINMTGELGGTGTVSGAVTAAAGNTTNGIIIPGGAIRLTDGAVGQLTLGSTLTLSGNISGAPNNLYLDLGNGAGGTDKIVATGAITASNANSAIINLNQLAGTVIDPGTYTLIQGGAASIGTGFTLATTKASHNFYTLNAFASNAQTVTVAAGTAGPVAAFWKGGANPWTTAANWNSDATSNVAASGIPGYQTNVTFATTAPAAGNLTTNTVDADFEINSLTFNGITGGVTLGGPKMITLNATTAGGNPLGRGITSGNFSGTNIISAKIGLGGNQTWTDSGGTLTVNGLITDFGAGYGLTKVGNGTLVLNGLNDYTGPTLVSSGVLLVGNSTALGTVAAGTTVATGAAVQIQSGWGIVVGAEALTLSGTGINSGGAMRAIGTVIYGGLITLGSDSRINSDTQPLALTHPGTITGAGFGLTIGGEGPTSISSIIGTASGTLTKDGGGTLTLSAANTYSGTTTISGGILKLGTAGTAPNSPLGTAAGATIVANSGAALDLAGFTLATAEPLTLNGTGFMFGGALTNSSGTAATYSGLLTLGSASSIVANSGNIILSNAGTITGSGFGLTLGGTALGNSIASAIGTGAGTLTKIDAGVWSLSGTNTYSGGTTISAGALSLLNTNAKPASGTINVAAGATLGLGVATAGSFFTTADVDALFANTLTNVNMSASSLVGIDTTATGGSFSYASSIPATTLGLNKLGSGTLTLTGVNSYTGPTVVTAGTLTISGSGTLGNSSSFNVTGAGTVDLGGTSQIVGAVNISVAATVSNGSLTGTSYAVSNPSGTATISANLLANGSAGLTKTGAGSANLTGVNTYTGTTTVNGGTLQVSGALGTINQSSAVALLNGGNLTLTNVNTTEALLNRVSDSAGITITNNGTLTFANTTGANLNYAETLGTVGLTTGQFNIVLPNDQNSTGSQTLTLGGLTHTGAATVVTLSAGGTAPNATKNMIKVTGAAATTAGQIFAPWATTGTAAALQTDYAVYDASANLVPANIAASAETTWTTAANSYTLNATTTLTATRTLSVLHYNGTDGTLTLAAGCNLQTSGVLFGGTSGKNLTIAPGTGGLLTTASGGGSLFLTAGNGNLTIAAPIIDNGGAVALIKSGAGSLSLSGVNTYSGGTVINSGTLSLGSQVNTALGSGPVTLNSGTKLQLARNQITRDLTMNGATLAGGGGWSDVHWAGTITLTGMNTLDFGDTASYIDCPVSGSGGVTKITAGGLRFNGTNTYTGPTIVCVGTLQIKNSLYGNDPAQWTPANITVASGATLAVNVGDGTDFTGSQAGTFFANLGTAVNNNGLKAGSAIAFDTSNGSATIAANLTDSSGPGGGAVFLKKIGGNTLTLTGASTFSGKIYIGFGGTLSVASFNSVNGGSPLLASSNAGAPTNKVNGTIDFGDNATNIGASLIYTGTGETTDRVMNLAGQGTNNNTITHSGTGLLKFTSAFTTNGNTGQGLTLTNSTAGAGEIAGVLPMVAGTLTKNGTGTWTLSGVNGYVGSTIINVGSLVIGGTGQLGKGNYTGTIPISSGANLTFNSSANQIISGAISGAGGTLTQAGAGTLTLAAGNSHTGATAVTAGKLLVNGSTAVGSAVSVSSGATLGGSGTINGDVTMNSGALLALSTSSQLTFKKLTLNTNVVHLSLPSGLADGVYTLGTYTAASFSGSFAPIPVIDSGSLANPGAQMTIAASSGAVLMTVGSPPITFSPSTIPNGTTIAPYSQTITAAGGNGAPFTNFTIASGALPPGLTLSSAGLIAGTPTTLGSFTFTVQVQDRGLFPADTPQSYTMSIVVPNTFTWKNAVTGDWSDASMWTNEYPGVVTAPTAAGQPNYVLNFTPDGTYTATANLNDGFLLNQLNFASAATIAGANRLALTNNGGTLPTINQNSGSGVTISAPVSMSADLTVGGSGTGDVTLNGALTGTGKLTKNTAGQALALTGTNTYTGGTVVNAGTLNMGAGTASLGAPGTINVTMASGTTLGLNRSNFVGALTLNGTTVIGGNGFGDSWGGSIVLGATSTIDSQTTGNETINADISGAGGLTKIGAGNGLAILNGTNTYTGPTTINAGILKITKPAALYNAVEAAWTAANITVASGGTLLLNVGGVNDFSGTQVGTLLTNLTAAVTNNGLKAGAAFGFDTGNAGATVVTVSRNLTDSVGTGGGAVSFKKFGGGILQFSGANTYTGQTFLDNGTLSAASFNSVATPTASSSLGRPTTVANGTIEIGNNANGNSGILVYTGGGETTDRVLHFIGQGNTLTLDQSGSGLLKFTSSISLGGNGNKTIALRGSTNGTAEIATPIVSFNSSGVTKSGAGTWTLSGVNTYTGATSISDGNLIIGGAGQLGGGTYAASIAVTASTATLTYHSTAAQTLSGEISGTGGLTQAGSGTLTLTGPNTYSGDTTVSGGILAVNGTAIADTNKLVVTGGKVEATGTETVDTLFFGATQQAVGTWGATGSGADHIDDVHFTGTTGVVNVLSARTDTPYSIWADAYLPADVSNPAADYDGDGLTNQQEFAFGLNPTLGTSVNPITTPLNKITGMFTYTRRDPELSNLTYTVLTSTDLVNWTPDVGGSQTPGTTDLSGVQAVVVAVGNSAVGGKLFVRVEAQ